MWSYIISERVTMWSYIIANVQRYYISTDTIDWEIFAVKIFSLLHWSDKN